MVDRAAGAAAARGVGLLVRLLRLVRQIRHQRDLTD